MKIRLKKNQIDTIKQLSKNIFNSSEVWIFGSRADETKKGGDIDIYLKTKKKENLLKSKIIFLREFTKLYGEQKVDLLVDNGNYQKEIYEIAQKGIKL